MIQLSTSDLTKQNELNKNENCVEDGIAKEKDRLGAELAKKEDRIIKLEEKFKKVIILFYN